MRILAATLAALWLVAATPAWSAAQAPPLSPDAYRQDLARLIDDIVRLNEARPAAAHREDASRVIASLPRSWRIAAGDRTWEIPATWLRRDLAAWRDKPDASARARTLAHLRALRDDAAAYLQTATDSSQARTTLTEILSAREFRSVQGPSWFDRLRHRAMAWLVALLDRTMGSALLPTISNILVYALIVLAVILVAFWIARSVRRSATAEATALDLTMVPVRPWNEWLDRARQAAEDGDWRHAVRLAYWCGVTYLETQGAWRADLSRTPREYLRLLPAASPQASPLHSLTRLLERIWYGGEPASRERYEDALAQLRNLGCPSV